MNEENATAIMMGNLKGPKIKPTNLIEIAIACRFLIKKMGINKMSERFYVSPYMIRQIDKINELDNPKLQKLIKAGKLGIEASYQLWRIKEPKRSQVANIIKSMNTSDVRRFVYFIVKNPHLSITDCKKLFLDEKPKNINILVLPINSEIYHELEKESQNNKLKIHDYVLKLLMERKI